MPSRDADGQRRGRDRATELTAVAAVTAAAKAVEEELRVQLAAKDEALRRVVSALLVCIVCTFFRGGGFCARRRRPRRGFPLQLERITDPESPTLLVHG